MNFSERGRPKNSSLAAIEEAAMELFLERGYRSTSVEDIASRAGISRASFFNYFPTKSDVLWIEVDKALVSLEDIKKSYLSLGRAVETVAQACQVDRIPLVVTQSETMGLTNELAETAGSRLVRFVDLLKNSGMDNKDSWLIAGAVVGILIDWLAEPNPRGNLADQLWTRFQSIQSVVSKQTAALLV